VPIWERRVLRLRPDRRVVLFDRLPADIRERLAPLRRDPDFYGVVTTADLATGDLGPDTPMVAVTRDVALLLLTLRDPGTLPAYVGDARADNIEPTLNQLILDGVLEVERDGSFVYGAAALENGTGEPTANGRLATISQAAIECAAFLVGATPADLEGRLYTYNFAPIGPRWSSRLGDRAAIRRFLGIDDGARARAIRAAWHGLREVDGWTVWSTNIAVQARPTEREVTYKLYVSPTIDALPDTLATAAPIFAEAHAFAFKVGASIRDVARPDKLVAYFDTKERALECGEMLAEALHDTPAQGVPFSADAGADGLVSWGVDPPERPGWVGDASWRRWVCRRLAHYLAAALAAPADDVSPTRFATERLRLDGVDTRSWAPDAARLANPAWMRELA
jgi:hypothetical protein